MKKKNESTRAEVLDGAPLQYAPQNELGVVFLFPYIAKKLRLRIEQIRPQFPDCVAYQKIRGREKRIRIEFEFRSRNFKTQGHRADQCDWLVCWEHNWPDVPNKLHVEELRKYFGLGFNVWIQPVGNQFKDNLKESDNTHWSVARNAHRGDLVLFYHNIPDMCIKDIFLVTGEVKFYQKANWREGKGSDFEADMCRVCGLDAPIFLEDLKQHKILKTSNFVRSNMRGRQNATEYWPYLYDLIYRRNASVRKKIAKYNPELI